MTDVSGAQRSNAWTWIGIAIVLAGPALAIAAKRAGYFGPVAIDATVLNWFAQWGAALTALLILVVFERQPLSAVGFKGLRGSSIAYGVLLGVIVIFLFPVAGMLIKALELPNPQSNFANLVALPLWARIATLITAGVTEEILFRGYPISRLEAATGSTLLAAAIPFVVFVILHLPSWGPAHLIFVSMAAFVLTVSYLWRRDLWTNIIAHIVVDSVPLIIVPLTGMPPAT